MIHLYIVQNGITDNEAHGYKFKDMMEKVNKKGFNVSLKDDVSAEELSNQSNLKKPLLVILLNSLKDEKILVVQVDDPATPREDIMDKMYDIVKGTSSVRHSKYELIFVESDYYILRKFPVTRKFKRGYKMKWGGITDQYKDLMDNSKFIKGWKFDAGNPQQMDGKDI